MKRTISIILLSIIAIMLGLCLTTSAQITPVDVTGPDYDKPNEAFTKLNANDAYLDSAGVQRLDSLIEAVSVIYTGQSPTTVTVGGLTAGTAISGDTYGEILQAIVAPYVSPVFGSFSVSGQATTEEVGATLSDSKTFTWSITENSGDVNVLDIYDITAGSTLVSGTANDGSHSATITTIQLNSNGATQQWRGIGYDANNSDATFNSSAFTVTARYKAFYGSDDAVPTNSAEVRALGSNSFVSGTHNVDFETGTEDLFFAVAVPPGWQVSAMIDLDAFSAPMPYTLIGQVNVDDAGGTAREYDLYAFNVDIPYPESHTIRATISPK